MDRSGTDWKKYFSGFGGKVYLNCAAQGPFPSESAEEVRRALRLKVHPEEIPETYFEDLTTRARAAVARLIGCHPSSIALCSGASHGLNVAARGLPLRSGDEVLLAQGEFPAVVYPWMNLESEGIQMRFVAHGSGRVVETADLIRAIGPRTRVIAISLVAYATGYRADLRALSEACRARGAFLVVDGAQAIGGIDFRVGDSSIDVLAVSGYKWLLGPFGTGFTYVSPRIIEHMKVADVNWLNIEGANQFNRRAGYALRFREGAQRFDIPEAASFLNLSGFAASIEFLNRVRVPTIEAHVGRLIERLIRGMASTPLRAVADLDPKKRSGLIGLEGPSIDVTRRIYRRLRGCGVVVSLRDNLVRVSPNIYNTADDIDRFLDTAAELA